MPPPPQHASPHTPHTPHPHTYPTYPAYPAPTPRAPCGPGKREVASNPSNHHGVALVSNPRFALLGPTRAAGRSVQPLSSNARHEDDGEGGEGHRGGRGRPAVVPALKGLVPSASQHVPEGVPRGEWRAAAVPALPVGPILAPGGPKGDRGGHGVGRSAGHSGMGKGAAGQKGAAGLVSVRSTDSMDHEPTGYVCMARCSCGSRGGECVLLPVFAS
jgi:hypothetical protein